MPENRLRVMVTGATGLTGSHTVRALLDAGHRVRAFIRGPEKARRVFGRQARQLELAVGDIADRTSVQQAVEGCDAHLARRVVPIELPLTAEAAAYITRWDSVPNSKTLIDMGVTFRDVGQSIADAVHWLEAAGHLEVRKH